MKNRLSIENDALVAVIGASGTMGRCAVASLLARDARVRVIARSLERVADLPSSVERVVADTANPADLVRALEGTRAVFYVSPHSPDEERLAENVVRACERTGTRLVFAGVHIDGSFAWTRAVMRGLFGLRVPHYRPKFRASEAVRDVRDTILLMPSNFCQNDELFLDAIFAGTLPEPLGRGGINRVDVRDVGDAAARALLDRSLAAGAYSVVGPSSLTGPECAAIWASALGREVRYTGDTDEWMRSIDAALTGKKRDDFLATFALMRDFALPTDPKQLAATTTLLGRPPRRYEEYVRDTVASRRVSRAA